MNQISQILIKHHVLFLFIILESISFQIILNNNLVQEVKFFKQINEIKGKIFSQEEKIYSYFKLKELNNELLLANTVLLNENILMKEKLEIIDSIKIDVPNKYVLGKVIRNSWNKKRNFLTLNIGSKHGIKKNMGVTSEHGLVGIVNNVSDNFSTVINIINTNLMISAKLKQSGYYGTLRWDGRNHTTLTLVDIPKNANCMIGDTIVTSGYSNIFPSDIIIGIIDNIVAEKHTNFLKIDVSIFTNFTNIKHAYVILNNESFERSLIEHKLKK
tara:strand:+ start:1271 stop:2086 length:816 start_codon:yes stop_codon:yes gene_type:complete